MEKTISTGYQDFAAFRDKDYFYIDKTGFIKEWWESGDAVTLITRPRRFGKTLNMSMVEQFFSVQYAKRPDLFDGLTIWKEEAYRSLQGTWPVIFISFAGIKGRTYEAAREGIIQRIIDVYTKYRFLTEGDVLSPAEKEYFGYIKPDMSDAMMEMSLHRLSICMERYYGKKVIILLDEYDTPLQEAYVGGYWDQLTGFVRGLFNNTFKTNPHMECSLMTGITRVSKESVFSDMNNLTVITTTSKRYADSFGFTEEEVFTALEEYGMADSKDKVKKWYDGFTFGGRRDIYNPWSITSFLKEKKIRTFWANTSENSLVDQMIRQGTVDVKLAMEDLLEDKILETPVDEEIVFSQLDSSDSALWSLLLASGYLKVEAVPEDDELEEGLYRLSLTNLEVKRMFRSMIRRWFRNSKTRYNDFLDALLADNLEYMNEYMNQIAIKTFSFFDAGREPSEQSEPERFYHGFVLGLIVDLSDDYRIISNRESGFGRYDVMIEPLAAGNPAFVLEFKVRSVSEESLSDTVKNALKQIEEKNYDAELTVRGIAKEQIRHYGFAFEGKKVLIG